eukprot:CAMPEP_0117053788 /NCGR_PEP_ID=MMETSP0472-20121206/37222_1 /TAXON_ID=693140 ORGANISM="Tiarina fusus, Strain LIS" /NCGR_SAMPLE_ID=MMETSP0472 /ASSEMBLY_ACC=CAM_ASM_000603 /LENGTH=565 /DNA_ID=CAMNT_0004769015 /DNA_START=31 /DNA_END=1728 /DNA_ORIENTATION=+
MTAPRPCRGFFSLTTAAAIAVFVTASKEKHAPLQTLALAPGDGDGDGNGNGNGDGAEYGNTLTFTALTKPLPLFPGEVTNTWHHLDIPPGPIAISEFSADVVEKDPTGDLVPVPLGDAYLHHHVVYSSHKHYENQKHWWSPMKPAAANRGVGFGAGTESRGTPQRFPYPYRFTTVAGEDELVANVHVINTRSMPMGSAHQCLECPCTAEDRVSRAAIERKREKKKGWFRFRDQDEMSTVSKQSGLGNTTLLESVIDRRSNWTRCNTQLVKEGNSACRPESYYGGLICCEHGEFCMDDYFMTKQQIADSDNSTQSVYYLRYSLTYEPLTQGIQPLYLAACCDASGNLTSSGNIEYDVPKLCDGPGAIGDGDGDGYACIHRLETVQTLHGAATGAFGTGSAVEDEDVYVDVVYMVGHLHRGGISMKAYHAANNSLLCESLPIYGTGGTGEIGNEPGYINSMSTCLFDPPLRMKTTEKIRVVGSYNATESHTGVMSLFYIAVADPPGTRIGGDASSIGFWKHFQPLAIFVAAGVVIGATWQFVTRYGYMATRRSGYEAVPSSGHSLSV